MASCPEIYVKSTHPSFHQFSSDQAPSSSTFSTSASLSSTTTYSSLMPSAAQTHTLKVYACTISKASCVRQAHAQAALCRMSSVLWKRFSSPSQLASSPSSRVCAIQSSRFCESSKKSSTETSFATFLSTAKSLVHSS